MFAMFVYTYLMITLVVMAAAYCVLATIAGIGGSNGRQLTETTQFVLSLVAGLLWPLTIWLPTATIKFIINRLRRK